MEFQYQAKSSQGQLNNGVVEAASLSEARQCLREQGLFILKITQATAGQVSKSLSKVGSSGRVKKTDLLFFTNQLTIMCRSGIDLAEALETSAAQCKNPTLKSALESIHQDVSDGQAVSVAMKKYDHIFGAAYVAGVAAGEASGTLVKILQRLSDLLRNEIRLRSTIRSILSYPLVLMAVALLVVMALIFFVLPQFAIVFRDLGKTPPPLTEIVLHVGVAVREYSLVIAAVLGLAGVSVYRFAKSQRALWLRDRFVLNSFMLRNATRPLLTGRIFRLLGTMLQSGIPLLEAVRLCRSSVKNVLFHNMFIVLEQEILNGKGVGLALSKFEFIPSGASQLIMTAEQTGKLGEVSQSIGEYYEDSGEENFRQLSKLLEPAIIVVMGAIVAFVMLSIMLPLLDVSTMSS